MAKAYKRNIFEILEFLGIAKPDRIAMDQKQIERLVVDIREALKTALEDLTIDADATAAEIAAGKIAYVDGKKVTGTFNFVAETAGTAVAAEIAAGKTAWVAGDEVTGTYDFEAATAGTATAADIAAGLTAWVNGVEITGTAE